MGASVIGEALAQCAAGIAALAAVWWGVGWWIGRMGLLRPNYRGARIPVGFGLVTVIWSYAALAYASQSDRLPHRTTWPYLVAIAGFGVLGLIDDVWGDRSATGLRGHLRALTRERRVTTGLIKASGGLLLAGALAAWVGEGSVARCLLGALTIALAANAVNLLDLRPGRAGAAYLVLAVALVAGLAARRHLAAAWPLILVSIPACAVYLADRRAAVMMGDVGANVLGAVLGLALVQCASPTWIALALGVLVVVHIFAERCSLSRAIENNPVLRALDRLTGVR